MKIVPYPPMLPRLRALLGPGSPLPELWAHAEWSSLSIDYHPPRVERLYLDTDINGAPTRIMLHRVHPCSSGQALWHAHPWPSAVALLSGRCEHTCGFQDRNGIHTVARTELAAGSMYEMTDPGALHAVRPLDGPTLSVMICGKPWARQHVLTPKPAPQRPLSPEEYESLHAAFGDVLVWNKAAQLISANTREQLPLSVDIELP